MTERYSSLRLMSGAAERVDPSLRIAPPELGALPWCYQVPVRLQDQYPSRPGGKVVRAKLEALH
jgi:hypothetical protein